MVLPCSGLRVACTRCLAGLLAIVLCAGGLSVRAQPDPTVKSARARIAKVITDTIEAAPYAGAFWGIEVTNLRTGRRLFRHNANRLFTPASNVKLLTTAAALKRLGPDFRYKTAVYVNGPVRNGVLHGNLIVQGSGDPTIGGYRQRKDPTQVFRRWADSLEEAGISRIQGDIIGDDDPFSDVPLGEGWSWNDVPYSYAAEVNGLVFSANTIDMSVTGRMSGAPARISWTPLQTDFVRVLNQTRTVPTDSSSDEEYDRPFGANTFQVRSRVHPGETQEESLTITNPTLYFTHVLREVLLQEGISVAGTGIDVDQMPIKPDYKAQSMRRVATYRSPSLRTIVRTTNHESQNLYAEQLLRTLAVVNPPDTTSETLTVGSAALGTRAVKAELAEADVDTSRIQLVDGSGLSRKNYVSPRALTRLLEHMWVDVGPNHSSAFYESLPTGGEEGTIEYRFRNGAPAQGNVHAKTGTLSHVSALSGYVNTEQGTPLSFVILCNHHLAEANQVRAAQDAIVNALARLPH